MAAYAVRAPDGVIAWFNSRAAKLWGRVPVIGDTDERFCGSHLLYHADGTYMAHCDTPVALALKTGVSVHEEEVVIERPDGSRVIVWVHIDPIRDSEGTIVGVVNFFRDITERKQKEVELRQLYEEAESHAARLREAHEQLELKVACSSRGGDWHWQGLRLSLPRRRRDQGVPHNQERSSRGRTSSPCSQARRPARSRKTSCWRDSHEVVETASRMIERRDFES